jgi:hypothetical protein
MIFSMINNNSYCLLLTLQYCSTRGLLLVDDSDEWFVVFHLFLVNAVIAVHEENVEPKKSCNNNVHNLRSNYFKKQLQMMSNEDDYMSDVTAMVISHPTCKSVEEPVDEHRLCAKRGIWRKILQSIRRNKESLLTVRGQK